MANPETVETRSWGKLYTCICIQNGSYYTYNIYIYIHGWLTPRESHRFDWLKIPRGPADVHRGHRKELLRLLRLRAARRGKKQALCSTIDLSSVVEFQLMVKGRFSWRRVGEPSPNRCPPQESRSVFLEFRKQRKVSYRVKVEGALPR